MRKIYLLLVFAVSSCLFSITHASGQIVIEMEQDGGVYKIPCEVNGLRLKLIFDTGASSVCISQSIADMMLENGYITHDDIVGNSASIVADGRIVDNTIINIKELKIGEVSLEDVQAVVIHNMSAPLLLGQSAIQKLGTITIDGNKLVLNKYTQTRQTENSSELLSIDERNNILTNAIEAYENEGYELAVKYYGVLYAQDLLPENEKKYYANSLRHVNRYEEALVIYHDIENNYLDHMNNEDQIWIYNYIQRCYYYLKDYNTSLLYGTKALKMSDFNSECRLNILYHIAKLHKDSSNAYRSTQVYKDEIKRYTSFMEISPTDCWDKEYKDPYMGELYLGLYLVAYPNDSDKYIAISAAWGNEAAIETAQKLSIKYDKKPSRYAY